MLTDEDLKAIEKMMASLLEAHGLKKVPSATALRMQRYRDRQRNASVTGRNEGVTASPTKRNATVTKRNNPVTDDTPVFITIPLIDGTEFGVTEKMVADFGDLYPVVDVPQTLREIKGWNYSRPKQRKTAAGIMKHINGWLAGEQNKG